MLTFNTSELYVYIAHLPDDETRNGLNFKTKKHVGNFIDPIIGLEMELWRIDSNEFSTIPVWQISYILGKTIDVPDTAKFLTDAFSRMKIMSEYSLVSKENVRVFLDY